MDSYNLLSSLLRPFLALLLLHSQLATAQNAKLFTEYIGAQYVGVTFSDVPINPSVDFHFILAFGIDYTTSTSPPSPTNGEFGIYWQTSSLTPDDVSSIKQSNPKVKVAVSLGGDTVNGSYVYFNATSLVDSWVTNAVSSITTIANKYHLDGIDIDYEHFGTDDVDTFVECIGQLVTILKRNGVISFASIAPFDNADVQRHYQALWAKYGSVIDYVNFQFYAYSSDTTMSQFLSHFETQRANYEGGKLLASFTTGTGGLSPANGFFDACKTLQSKGELQGIFVWAADISKSNGGFQYEKQAQELLAAT